MPPQVPTGGVAQGAAPLPLQKPLLSCVPHRYSRDVSRLCHLSAGTYTIVPSTYLPDTEGSFTVTIATRVDRWAAGDLVPRAHHGPTSPACPRAQLSAAGQRSEAATRGRTPACLSPCGGRADGLSTCPPCRKRDPEGDRAVLCHRRSIHSQEMLGQLLQEVRRPGGSLTQPPRSPVPAAAPQAALCSRTRGALVSSPERPWAELPRGREAAAVPAGAEEGRPHPAFHGGRCPDVTVSPSAGLLHGGDEDLTGRLRVRSVTGPRGLPVARGGLSCAGRLRVPAGAGGQPRPGEEAAPGAGRQRKRACVSPLTPDSSSQEARVLPRLRGAACSSRTRVSRHRSFKTVLTGVSRM